MRNRSILGPAVVLIHSVLLIACVNPVKPDSVKSNDDLLPPDQSQYEVLPTERHYLVGPSTGQGTKMWAKLFPVSPPRGSGIALGPEVCPKDCFKFSLEMGFETVENPNVVATIRVGFSHDGQTIYRDLIGGYAVKTGQIVIVGGNMISRFDEVPEYLVVEGSHWDNTAPNQMRSGKTMFVLDYHLKEPAAGSS